MYACRRPPSICCVCPQPSGAAGQLGVDGGAVTMGTKLLLNVPPAAELFQPQEFRAPPLQPRSQQTPHPQWPFVSGHQSWAVVTDTLQGIQPSRRLRMSSLATLRVPPALCLTTAVRRPRWRAGYAAWASAARSACSWSLSRARRSTHASRRSEPCVHRPPHPRPCAQPRLHLRCSPTTAMIHAVAGLVCAIFLATDDDLGLDPGLLLSLCAGLCVSRGAWPAGSSAVHPRARAIDRDRLAESACGRVARIGEHHERNLMVCRDACG